MTSQTARCARLAHHKKTHAFQSRVPNLLVKTLVLLRVQSHTRPRQVPYSHTRGVTETPACRHRPKHSRGLRCRRERCVRQRHRERLVSCLRERRRHHRHRRLHTPQRHATLIHHVRQRLRVRHHVVRRLSRVVWLQHKAAELSAQQKRARYQQPVVHQSLQLKHHA